MLVSIAVGDVGPLFGSDEGPITCVGCSAVVTCELSCTGWRIGTDFCTVCVLVNVLSCLLIVDVSADLERFLCRWLPSLPCLGQLRALASLLKGEVALLGVLLDSEPAVSGTLRTFTLLSLALSVVVSVATTASVCLAVELRVTTLRGGSVLGSLFS